MSMDIASILIITSPVGVPLLVGGGIPGHPGAMVTIRKSIKKSGKT